MAKLWRLLEDDEGPYYVCVGWILHLVGRWYLQWRLGRLRVVRKGK